MNLLTINGRKNSTRMIVYLITCMSVVVSATDLIKSGLTDLMRCLGNCTANYEYKNTPYSGVEVFPKYRDHLDLHGKDRILIECLGKIDNGYDILITSRPEAQYDSQDDNSSEYSGPIGNALEPISSGEEENIPRVQLLLNLNNTGLNCPGQIIANIRAVVEGHGSKHCKGDTTFRATEYYYDSRINLQLNEIAKWV